eukprot:COSAG06_NODE_3032_length_5939_cov_4.174114_6_plen_46_part_00
MAAGRARLVKMLPLLRAALAHAQRWPRGARGRRAAGRIFTSMQHS